MKSYAWLLLLSLALLSCDNLVKSKDSNAKARGQNSPAKQNSTETNDDVKSKDLPEDDPDNNSDADILNNIIVHQSGGLQVGQAYLSYEDGKLVAKSNKVRLGETVLLNLVIDGGWKTRNGEASLDATEIITTSDGEMVLNARNLFKSKPTVTERDAGRIFLKATVTKTRSDIDHFIINYRVWDKWGDGEVRGSYKLYIGEETE